MNDSVCTKRERKKNSYEDDDDDYRTTFSFIQA